MVGNHGELPKYVVELCQVRLDLGPKRAKVWKDNNPMPEKVRVLLMADHPSLVPCSACGKAHKAIVVDGVGFCAVVGELILPADDMHKEPMLLGNGEDPVGFHQFIHAWMGMHGPFTDGADPSLAGVHYVLPKDWDETASYGEKFTFRIVTWKIDEVSSVRNVSNIKEQPVEFHTPDSYIQQRVENYLTAWANVMREVLSVEDSAVACMPADFFKGKSPLLLKKATTVADFEKALRAKKRLGRWL